VTTENENKPTNVLKFPKHKQPVSLSAAQSKEEFVKQLGENKERYIDMVLARTMNQLYGRMAAEGFNTEDDAFFTDFCFVVEALKSAMLRQCGLEHSLQKFVDENFEAAPQSEEMEDYEEYLGKNDDEDK
jgi:hypothetical protein